MPAAVIDAKRRQLAALRTLIAEKFPSGVSPAGRRWRTGCEALDGRGGLIRGALTEVCGSSGGGQLVLAAVLEMAVREGFFLGLIDGADALEPADWPEEQLRRLFWVRCGGSEPALKAADLLIRDGNLPVLLLDLQMVSPSQLRRIPVSTWHRFHRVLESSEIILLVLTPRPLVEAAPCRMALRTEIARGQWSLPRKFLLRNLQVRIFKRGNPNLQISD